MSTDESLGIPWYYIRFRGQRFLLRTAPVLEHYVTFGYVTGNNVKLYALTVVFLLLC